MKRLARRRAAKRMLPPWFRVALAVATRGVAAYRRLTPKQRQRAVEIIRARNAEPRRITRAERRELRAIARVAVGR